VPPPLNPADGDIRWIDAPIRYSNILFPRVASCPFMRTVKGTVEAPPVCFGDLHMSEFSFKYTAETAIDPKMQDNLVELKNVVPVTVTCVLPSNTPHAGFMLRILGASMYVYALSFAKRAPFMEIRRIATLIPDGGATQDTKVELIKDMGICFVSKRQ